MRTLSWTRFLGIAGLLGVLYSFSQDARKSHPYAEALNAVKIPPDWLAAQNTTYDTARPWKEARLHIRALLKQGGAASREAITLTYTYLIEKKSADLHEYPMYVYLGREFAWAAVIYEDWLLAQKLTEAVQYRHLASCQLYFGEPGKALETLRVGLRRLPDTPQRVMNEAALHDCMADVYAKMGDKAMATAEYHKALELFAKRPKGLSKNAAVTQAKLEMLAETLNVARIPDGSYTSSAFGYVGDVKATVRVRNGRIADVRVQHTENLDAGASKSIPQRIVAQQTPDVDAVTAATVTSHAIRAATWQALKTAQKP